MTSTRRALLSMKNGTQVARFWAWLWNFLHNEWFNICMQIRRRHVYSFVKDIWDHYTPYLWGYSLLLHIYHYGLKDSRKKESSHHRYFPFPYCYPRTKTQRELHYHLLLLLLLLLRDDLEGGMEQLDDMTRIQPPQAHLLMTWHSRQQQRQQFIEFSWAVACWTYLLWCGTKDERWTW